MPTPRTIVMTAGLATVAGAIVVAGFWLVLRRAPTSDSANRPNATQPTDRGETPPGSAVNPSEGASTVRFATVDDSSGIAFRHNSGNSDERPFPAANGSGIGAIDYDLDGQHDLYFATGRSFPVDVPPIVAATNRCYRNEGNWKFRDVTTETGLGHDGYSAGIAVGDYDSDGFPDIYVSCYGPNVLYHNQGDGTFARVETAAGVDDDRWGTSAAFLDYDHDGGLDLYCCNYAKWTLADNHFCGNRRRGVRIFCSPSSVEPEGHLLYHNEQDGTFRESSHLAGIDARSGRGQGVVAGDVNGDGLIDLYVSNDIHPNFLFLNAGNGRFDDVGDESGAAFDRSGQCQAGMGVDLDDLNGDGRPELFVTNFEKEYNTLYMNLGNQQFQDVSESTGLAAASRPWVGWGTVLADFDGDGQCDVFVTNGHTDSNLADMDRDSSYIQPPLLWLGRGKRFDVAGESAGDYFQGRYAGRAVSMADLDNDGDPDLVVGHQDGSPALLKNVSLRVPATARLQLKLIGRNCNRDGVGATVRIECGVRTTHHFVRGGGSYLSARDQRITAICLEQTPPVVFIRWPGGMQSRIEGLSGNACYALIEPHLDTPQTATKLFDILPNVDHN